jgi:hypothetical protein
VNFLSAIPFLPVTSHPVRLLAPLNVSLTCCFSLYLGDLVPPTIRGAAVQAVQFANIFSSVIVSRQRPFVLPWCPMSSYWIFQATIIIYRTDKIDGPYSYHVPLIVQACAPVLLTALTFFIAQSPLDLLQRGRESEVQPTLRTLRRFTEAELQDEYRNMLESERQSKALSEGAKFSDLFSKRHIKVSLAEPVI